jgi:hypothetical protein
LTEAATEDENDPYECECVKDWTEPTTRPQDKIKLVPTCVREQNQYARAMEERVSRLEACWDSYQKERDVLEKKNVELPRKPLKPVIIPKLAFKSWEEFISNEPKSHMIDVLIGEPFVVKEGEIRLSDYRVYCTGLGPPPQ